MLKKKIKKDTRMLARPWVIFFISFCLCLIMAVLIIIRIESHNMAMARAKALRVVGNYVSSFERVINNNLAVNYSLGMLIHEGEEGRIEKLEEFGKQILQLHPDIANISLAPDGVVQEIIPLEGNEGAVGHDLFKDKNRVTEAIETKESGVLTVAGPFNLIQGGGLSIIGRLPVFITGESGIQNFWGFTGVAMTIDSILNEVEIEKLEEMGYEYELWRLNPDTNEKEMIALSESPLTEAEEQEIILPNGEWVLGISPMNGWRNKQHTFRYVIIGAMFSTLIGALFWMIIELRNNKIALEQIAFYDGLTGLANRRLFFDRLQQAMAHSKRENTLLALCYMDIDDFKHINDTLGHEAGDYVLVEIGRRHKNVMRATDTISRLGGDEFAVLICGLKYKKECIGILERIKSVTIEPIIFEGHPITVSISMGVTIFPTDGGDTNEALLRQADQALYKVKEEKKGEYRFYEPEEF